MPPDPSDPSSPKPSTRLYQTTSDSPKGGGGGAFLIVLLLLVLGGAAAYYFLFYKPAVAAPAMVNTAKPTATPTASAGAPSPAKASNIDASGNATYSRAQRAQYIQTAIDSFKLVRQSKLQPFTEAYSALITAGAFSAASLPSKEAIAARRELVKKCLAANDDYAAFVKGQEAAYRDELKKTPLIPNDVEVETSLTGANMPTEKILQLRTTQGDTLKTGDQILGYLDSTFGGWSVNAEKHIVFKKTADGTPFNALLKTYNEQITALNKFKEEINANASDPTAPAASPGASPVAPAASPAASAAP